MKKVLLFFLIIILIGCGSTSVLVNNYDYKFRKVEQLDSVMNVERLPKNLDKYEKMTFYIEEDSIIIKQYVYIKSNDSSSIIFTITDLDSLYRIRKKTLNY